MSAYTRGRRPSSSPASPARNSALSWFRSHTATSSILASELLATWAMPRTCRRPIPPQPISAIGMRPDMTSDSGGGQSAAIGERVRSDIEKRLASLEKTLQLVDHETEEPRPTGSGDTGDVRTHEHVGQLTNRTRGGNRLWV